jgi:hypothetical protein
MQRNRIKNYRNIGLGAYDQMSSQNRKDQHFFLAMKQKSADITLFYLKIQTLINAKWEKNP